MTNVAICVATYKRPEGLNRLLESLSRLELNESLDSQVRVIVVDNDKYGSAKQIVKNWAAKMPFSIAYDIEPRQGICYARNKLVSLARGADFIAFVDDDEIAHAKWLDELLDAQKAFNADVVMGAVQSRFKQSPPKWLVEGRFFQGSKRPDGIVIDHAFTNNVLVRYEILEWVSGPFDVRLNLCGGSDTLLFRHLHRLGARMVFSNKAIVEEIVPQKRTTLKWYCQRAYRIGNTNVLIDCYLGKSFDRILRYLGLSIGRFCQGVLLLAVSIFKGQTIAVKGLLSLCLGSGNLAGLFGLRYQEYKNLTGE